MDLVRPSPGAAFGSDSLGFSNVDKTPLPRSFVAYLEWSQTIPSLVAHKAALMNLLAPAPGEAVLDAGCGVGDDVRSMAARVGSLGAVTGVDLSAVMLAAAGARGGTAQTRFVSGDAASLPFADGWFDAARADSLLLHVDRPAEVISELLRVVRPGGRLMLTEPDWNAARIDVGESSVSRLIVALSARAKHPAVGAHLGSLARDHDAHVHIRSYTHMFTDSLTMSMYLGLEAAAERAVDNKIIAEGPVREWLRDLRRSDGERSFRGSTAMVTALLMKR